MKIKWKALLSDIKVAVAQGKDKVFIDSMIDGYVEAKEASKAELRKWIERSAALVYFVVSLILYLF